MGILAVSLMVLFFIGALSGEFLIKFPFCGLSKLKSLSMFFYEPFIRCRVDGVQDHGNVFHGLMNHELFKRHQLLNDAIPFNLRSGQFGDGWTLIYSVFFFIQRNKIWIFFQFRKKILNALDIFELNLRIIVYNFFKIYSTTVWRDSAPVWVPEVIWLKRSSITCTLETSNQILAFVGDVSWEIFD